MINYNVKLIQFPNSKVHESVIENEDGSYTIFINSTLSMERQKESFKHAMVHILGDDFTKDNINEIESEAHSA